MIRSSEVSTYLEASLTGFFASSKKLHNYYDRNMNRLYIRSSFKDTYSCFLCEHKNSMVDCKSENPRCSDISLASGLGCFESSSEYDASNIT